MGLPVRMRKKKGWPRRTRREKKDPLLISTAAAAAATAAATAAAEFRTARRRIRTKRKGTLGTTMTTTIMPPPPLLLLLLLRTSTTMITTRAMTMRAHQQEQTKWRTTLLSSCVCCPRHSPARIWALSGAAQRSGPAVGVAGAPPPPRRRRRSTKHPNGMAKPRKLRRPPLPVTAARDDEEGQRDAAIVVRHRRFDHPSRRSSRSHRPDFAPLQQRVVRRLRPRRPLPNDPLAPTHRRRRQRPSLTKRTRPPILLLRHAAPLL